MNLRDAWDKVTVASEVTPVRVDVHKNVDSSVSASVKGEFPEAPVSFVKSNDDVPSVPTLIERDNVTDLSFHPTA